MSIYFEKISRNKYFCSDDFGNNLIVTEKEFKKIISNKKNYLAITGKNKVEINIKSSLKTYFSLNKYLYQPPSLHIIVLTLRCNHKCTYCRTTNNNFKNTDMDLKTLKATIDFIFSTPNKNITIEFQGGEPLIKWNLIEKAVGYINEVNKKYSKNLLISIVSNLSLMDDEKLKFIIKNNISICTSIDGPQYLHNANRLYFGGSSYEKTIYWYKKIKKIMEKINKGENDSLPSALMTTTKLSLKYPQEIIDEYRKLNTGGIFIRPLSPIGYAKNVWHKIGYEADEFLSFYEKAIDYLLKINLKGEKFVERNAAIKLKKILFKEDPNFLDLRSPCGAVMGQLAYNYNGDIYTCDEGRMVGAQNDYTFKVGNVFKSIYSKVIKSKNCKNCISASILENQVLCYKCAFKPFCGVCPVFNYETSKTLAGSFTSFYWCKIEKGIFKILIDRLGSDKIYKIFLRWFDA